MILNYPYTISWLKGCKDREEYSKIKQELKKSVNCRMFTGIIEDMGKVKGIQRQGTNYTFWIESTLSQALKIDQSLSHNGVCLTVEEVQGNSHRVTAIRETIEKTNLGELKTDELVNLERCLKMNGRLDGHIVQGHVDGTGVCEKFTEKNGSWEFEFSFNHQMAHLIIEKGSICVNGISLTAFNVRKKKFTVAIIPYTYTHTNLCKLRKGEMVNLEFDIIGKYLDRKFSLAK